MRRITSSLAASIVCGAALLLAGSNSTHADDSPVARAKDGPLAPEEALAAFKLEPGLRAELVAAEPLVVSPCAVAFDEWGRMFVAENRGYPTGPKQGEPPVGRVALLEDVDGDGRFEKRTEFAEGLTYPNGVMPWKGGLIVTCAPEILYLKDTDGDGKADTREVWFTGFSTKGSTQLRVSHPTLSIDGWIYVTSGLTGGEVTCPKHAEREPVKLGRTDFRFRPDLSDYEACDGGAQFGLSFDDFGRRFICYNRVQVQHVVLPSKALRRNANLAFSETVQNCPADLSPEPLKGHGAAARLYPISTNITTADSHAGTFTAACAVTVWRGDALPLNYNGGVFSCDPTGNLVHFDKLEQNGATFTARRAREGTEFLASADNWFRPVFLSHGPDGALYVVDMYRKTIEHPDYLPVEVRKHTDFEGGKTMGRIWRVVAAKKSAGELSDKRRKGFDARSPESLCQALDDASGWRRSTAFRLLLERNDAADVPAIRALLGSGETTMARVAALQLLGHFGAVDTATRGRCFAEASRPALREAAVQILAGRIAGMPEAADELRPLAADPNARVRFQTALALGELTDERAVDALASIARLDGADRWARAAVLSGISGREPAFLKSLLRLSGRDSGAELYAELGRILGASRPPAEWPGLLKTVLLDAAQLAPDLQKVLLTGFGESIRNRRAKGETRLTLFDLAIDDPALNKALDACVSDAREIAADGRKSSEQRTAAVQLLGLGDFDAVGTALLDLVVPGEASQVQSAAVRALGRMQSDRIAPALLSAKAFGGMMPALREEVLAAMLSNPQHVAGLLTAIEAGVVPKIAIDSLRKRQLTQHKDPAIRERANRLFALESTGNRARVYDDLKSVVSLEAHSDNGRAVFKRVCAACHRLEREGSAVGPDLFGIRNQPKEAILLHIVIPEQEITPGFAAYVLTTKEGRVLTGLVSSETPTSVTLKQPQGKEESVLRSDIEELTMSKLSLMPQNLETQLTRQEFADLLSYLKGEK